MFAYINMNISGYTIVLAYVDMLEWPIYPIFHTYIKNKKIKVLK